MAQSAPAPGQQPAGREGVNKTLGPTVLELGMPTPGELRGQESCAPLGAGMRPDLRRVHKSKGTLSGRKSFPPTLIPSPQRKCLDFGYRYENLCEQHRFIVLLRGSLSKSVQDTRDSSLVVTEMRSSGRLSAVTGELGAGHTVTGSSDSCLRHAVRNTIDWTD